MSSNGGGKGSKFKELQDAGVIPEKHVPDHAGVLESVVEGMDPREIAMLKKMREKLSAEYRKQGVEEPDEPGANFVV